MGPKKNKLTASTPAVPHSYPTFSGMSDNSVPSTINESSFVLGNVEEVALKQPTIPKVTTLDLILKAIETVGVPRKGASYLAIQKWIISYKENVEINRLRAHMKKAIVKAVESGVLKRPTASKNATGLKGYFLINKEVNIPKNTTTKTAKPAVGKEKALKIPKAKGTTAPNPKGEESESDDEEETNAKPKNKIMKSKYNAEKATAKPKTKTVKSKSDPEETSAKSKAGKSKSDTEEATSSKPKTKAGKSKSDTESGPSGKGKAKAVVKAKPSKDGAKAIAANVVSDGEDLPISKQKTVQSRTNGVKVPTEEESNKVLKNTSKPTKNVKVGSKEPRSKKLYSSRMNPATNISRKDLSDTELNVKPDNRKSLKSYSSDTEVEVTKKKRGAKNTKIVDAKKNKAGPVNTKKQNTQDESY